MIVFIRTLIVKKQSDLVVITSAWHITDSYTIILDMLTGMPIEPCSNKVYSTDLEGFA